MHTFYRQHIFSIKCPFKNCDATFERDGLLQRHVHIHENIKYECQFCPYSTAQKTNLMSHYRSHYGVREFKCDKCDKCFDNQGLLSGHYQKHEGITYVCKLCSNFQTDTRKNMTFHMRVHHMDTIKHCHWKIITEYIREETDLLKMKMEYS